MGLSQGNSSMVNRGHPGPPLSNITNSQINQHSGLIPLENTSIDKSKIRPNVVIDLTEDDIDENGGYVTPVSLRETRTTVFSSVNCSNNSKSGNSITPLSDITNVLGTSSSRGYNTKIRRSNIPNVSRMVIDLSDDDTGGVVDLSETVAVDSHVESCGSLFNNGQHLDVQKKVILPPFVPPFKIDYDDLGDPTFKCQHCFAFFWYNERLGARYNSANPKYSGCCSSGKIILPAFNSPPTKLRDLFFGGDDASKHFLENIRSYNSMFCFTSMGGKVDRSMNTGNAPPVFTIHGQNHHLIGSLVPVDGTTPKFAQLYIYDTHNEIENRLKSVRIGSKSDKLHAKIVGDLRETLDRENRLVRHFRMARDKISAEGSRKISMALLRPRSKDSRQYNLPEFEEIAALVVGDVGSAFGNRDIVIEHQSGVLKRIDEHHPCYLPLQYPLLFPYGEDGYSDEIQFSDIVASGPGGRTHISEREYAAYRLHDRPGEPSLMLRARRLTQQIIVDLYTMVESNRLSYISNNQNTLRSEMYQCMNDALLAGETDARNVGTRTILPSSFTGGARYMIQNYQDAMAICRSVGYPDLFITFTCNPKWPEIVRELSSLNLKPEDRPDIVVRVFKMKLDTLMKVFRKKRVFGTVVAAIYTVEFQKRGLPHAHILLFLAKENKYPTGEDIDGIISAEIPDEIADPEYYSAVREYMVHGPCGHLNVKSPCMAESRCTKHFPKEFIEMTTVDCDGFPIYRRRDLGRQVVKNGVPLDNRWIVPHNRFLLMLYKGHLNVEWCNQSRSIKYLFKYVNKGHDRVTAVFYETSRDGEIIRKVNEVKDYYDCRYISPCEAAWRIFGNEIQFKDPPVERLSFHLPNQQNVVFSESDSLKEALKKATVKESQFEGWFRANRANPWAKDLTYVQFPEYFVWNKTDREWTRRKRGRCIGRIYHVHPGAGDVYYLRLLLNVQTGCKSYEDLKLVKTIQHDTYRDACYALGLIDDDKEYTDAIMSASQWATASELRRLFATLLTSDCLSKPEKTWEDCWVQLSDDLQRRQRRLLNRADLVLTDEVKQNLALIEIDNILRTRGKSLRDYPKMRIPDREHSVEIHNSIINDELRYDRVEMLHEFERLHSSLNDDQRIVFTTITNAVEQNRGGLFFVCGYGGTGKTFVWKTLSAFIRSQGNIVLNVASSGIAALLLPGGRTAHSRFKIPLNVNEDSICKITPGSPLAHLLKLTKLIIWDEAPMMQKYCFEALDRTLHDIMKTKGTNASGIPFGGKVVVLGGDFRQILPVIPKGSRQHIVNASINSSYLWSTCKVLKLTKNMRLLNCRTEEDSEELRKFSEWIANIGDGTVGPENDGVVEIEIPEDIVLHGGDDPIGRIVSSIYPSFDGSKVDSTYLNGRAILASTLDMVDEINDHMTTLNKNEATEYLSYDSPCRSETGFGSLQNIHSPEYLNSLKFSGLPNHKLTLKVGTPVMLLRNIDHSLGLCNGTRMVITRLTEHVLEARLIAGRNTGDTVLLPRMTLSTSDSSIPFKFQRRQFPIIVSYAMTINKSQGQSLSNVGLYLKRPVFSHGQLYVAISRVTNREGLKILICDKNKKPCSVTTNVVYKEIFQNLQGDE